MNTKAEKECVCGHWESRHVPYSEIYCEICPCKIFKRKATEEWEKEFDEIYPMETTADHVDRKATVILTKRSVATKENLKDFFRETLSRERQKIREVVEKMKDEIKDKEPEDTARWSKTGYVVYYYLDRITSALEGEEI